MTSITAWTYPNASAYYRCELPLAELARQGLAETRCVDLTQAQVIMPSDVNVFQLCTVPPMLAAQRQFAEQGFTCISETDDEIDDIPVENPTYHWIHPDSYKNIARFLFVTGQLPPGTPEPRKTLDMLLPIVSRCQSADQAFEQAPLNYGIEIYRNSLTEAHGVTVSTHRLARKYAHLNPNTRALPNCIDLSLPCYQAEREPHEDIIVGWGGGITHNADLAMIAQVLASILREYDGTHGPRVRLMVAGDFTPFTGALSGLPDVDKFCAQAQEIPGWPLPGIGFTDEERATFTLESECGRYLWRPFQHITCYPAVYRDIDIGIIPNRLGLSFTDAKSDVKGVEMAGVGVPCIASPTAEYRKWRRKGTGCWLLKDNEPRNWQIALRTLIDLPRLRETLLAEARAFAESRDIRHWAPKWLEFYEGAHVTSPVSSRQAPPMYRAVSFFNLALRPESNGLFRVACAVDDVETMMAQSLSRPGDVILVAGAGYGATVATLGALSNPARLIAVEPDPTKVAAGRANVRVDGIPIEWIEGAITESGKRAPFRVVEGEGWHSSAIASSHYEHGAISVETHTLDALLERTGANGAVIDIEGAEAAVIPASTLKALDWLVVEIHKPEWVTPITESLARCGLHVRDTRWPVPGQVAVIGASR